MDVRVELDPYGPYSLAKPVVIGAAGPEEHVELIVGGQEYRGLSDYELLEGAIAPVLADESLTLEQLADFDETEIGLLSSKTGVSPTDLVLLKQSAALAAETRLPTAVFYGMGRQKMILGLPALLATDPTKRRAAMMAAIDANQISMRLIDDAERMLDTLNELTIVEALRQRAGAGVTTIGALLAIAGLAAEKQSKLAHAYCGAQWDGRIVLGACT